MKKNVTIIMFIFMGIIIVLLTVICVMLFFKNDDNKSNSKPKGKKIEERLKEAFLSEKYKLVTKNNLRKQVKENDGTGCLEQEYYNFNLKEKLFTYGLISEINNECVGISVTYYAALDTGYYAYTRRPKDSYTLVFYEHTEESYDFNTGANNCESNCYKIREFKNQFLTILKKHDINLNELK